MQLTHRLILASASPRRSALLKALHVAFEARPTHVDETVEADMPCFDVAQHLAKRKASAALQQASVGELILAADSVVVLHDEIIGKPANEAEARRFLERLCGQTHTVVTGVALGTYEQGPERLDCFSEYTTVEMSAVSSAEIAAYVDEGHSLDRAGAYGIQDWIGWAACRCIDGSYSNVMGLPTEAVYRRLKAYQRS